MVNEHFNHSSWCSITAVLLASLVGYLLFFAMCNIWFVDMAVTNLITLTVGVMKYVIPQKSQKREYYGAANSLCTGVYFSLLPSFLWERI